MGNLSYIKRVKFYKCLMILSYFCITLFISQTATSGEPHYFSRQPDRGVFNFRYYYMSEDYNDVPRPKANSWPFSRATDRFDGMLAADRLMSVLITPETAPLYGIECTDALSLSLAYVPYFDYVFGSMEKKLAYGIDDAKVLEEIVEMVRLVRTDPKAGIRNAKIGNYYFWAAETDNVESDPEIYTPGQSNDRTELHNLYMSTGLNVSMPQCYPISAWEIHATYDRWLGTESPNIRAALFWATLDVYTVAKNDLPDGHELIPWVGEYFTWDTPPTDPNERPTPEDNIAMLQHIRLRGTDGFYAFRNFDTLHYSTVDDYYDAMADAWYVLDDSFEKNGINVPLNLTTDRASGVEWSAIRNRNKITLLVSNMNTVGSYDIANNIGNELSKWNIESSAVVPADTHQLFRFNISNLIGNGDFEGANIDWTLTNGSLEEGEGVNNTDCLKAQGGYDAATTVEPIYVEPGEQVKIGYYAKGQSNAVLDIGYSYYNSSDVYMGTVNVSGVTPGSIYKRYESIFTVLDNSDIDHIKLHLSNVHGGTDANDIIWIDDMVIKYFNPNLIDNGDFQNGNENWNLSGGASQAILDEGIRNCSLKLTGDCLVNGTQKIYVEPGEPMKLTYYAKGVSDPRFQVWCASYDISGNFLELSTAHNNDTLTVDFQKYESFFIVPDNPDIHSVQLCLFNADGNIDANDIIWVDNISISKAKIASFQLNENSGTIVHDLMGNIANGTIYGADWSSGISGSALDFNGTSDYVDFGNPAALELSGSRTVSAWIKPESNGAYNGIVAKNLWAFGLLTCDGKLRAYLAGSDTDAQSRSNESLTVGEWQHVAMTFDVNGDKKIHLYINGSEVTYSRQDTMVGSPVNNSTWNFTIGSDRGTGSWFNGLIDEVEIFACAFTSKEIFDRYGQVFYADFDEASGAVANNSTWGNEGTIYGAVRVPGISGSALDFNGTGDYVDFGNPAAFEISGSRTVSAWVKPATNGAYNGIVAKNLWAFGLLTCDGTLRAYLAGSDTDAQSRSNESLTVGEWQHVAMTFDVNGDKKIRLYINGSEVTYSRQTAMVGSPVNNSTWNFTIGSDRNIGSWFDGLIDEVKVYNTAFSRGEVFKESASLYVDFDKVDDEILADDSAFGNNGAIYGADRVAGISGQALNFDSVDDYVDCGNDPALELTGSRTVSAWIKPDSNGSYNGIVAKNLWAFGLLTCDGKLRAYLAGSDTDAQSRSNESLTVGEWQHVAMTFDATAASKVIRLYINGKEVTYSRQTAMVGSPVNNSTWNFTIGSDRGTGSWFDGLIDEVKVFNFAFSNDEVLKESACLDVDFDKVSGAVTNDYALENNGTIYGAEEAPGISGSALDFNGTSDYVDFGSPAALELSGSRTISAWIKPDINGSYNSIAGKNIWAFGLLTCDGKLRAYLAGSDTGAESRSNESLTVGVWQHVAMTFDATAASKVIRLYINGSEVTYSRQTAMVGSLVNNSTWNFTIGSDRGTGSWFDGLIDEVKVYNNALSSSEVNSIYQSY